MMMMIVVSICEPAAALNQIVQPITNKYLDHKKYEFLFEFIMDIVRD